MKQKKGISPLIATVLILGFTVALAAIIMVWGQRFTTGTMKTTEETSNLQMACATDVDFDMSVCKTAAGLYYMTIDNKGTKKIEDLAMRFYDADGTTITGKNAGNDGLFDSGVEAYAITDGTYTAGASEATDLVLVEAVPKISIGGKLYLCAANKKSFGEIGGLGIEACV